MVRKSLQKAHAKGEGCSPSFRPNGRVRDKSDHVVQFHNDGADLVDTVVEFVGSALQAGEGAVVLATRKHRDT